MSPGDSPQLGLLSALLQILCACSCKPATAASLQHPRCREWSVLLWFHYCLAAPAHRGLFPLCYSQPLMSAHPTLGCLESVSVLLQEILFAALRQRARLSVSRCIPLFRDSPAHSGFSRLLPC